MSIDRAENMPKPTARLLLKPIKTTGDLRLFLSDLLSSVRDGTADLDAARTMVKLAAQINESFYSETKVAMVDIELKRTPAELGDLSLGGTREPV